MSVSSIGKRVEGLEFTEAPLWRDKYLMTHHADMPKSWFEKNGFNDVEAIAEEIDRWHRSRSRPFALIGYHYVVCGNEVFETNRIGMKSAAHCLGTMNREAIGICIVNKGTEDALLPEEIGVIKALYDFLGSKAIVFHRDYVGTTCPGDVFLDSLMASELAPLVQRNVNV